jgi:uncharacterized protein DUF1569
MKTLADPRAKAELLHRLRNVGPDSVRRWGVMSVGQMVCHLTDSFRLMTGQRAVSDASSPVHRTLVKWIALFVPLQWPRGIATRPEVDQQLGGTKPTNFDADLRELEAIIEQLATSPTRYGSQRHPIFGRMSHADWMRWAYLHVDHHLRQFGK